MDKIVVVLMVAVTIIVGMCFGYMLACTTFDAEAYIPQAVVKYDSKVVFDTKIPEPAFLLRSLRLMDGSLEPGTIEFDPNYYDYSIDTQVAKVIIKFIPKVSPMVYEEDYEYEADRCL